MTAPVALRKRSKYGSRKVVTNGITFDSVKEANRYAVLFMMQQAGEISNLRLQVPYELTLKVTYVADFVYDDGAGEVVEDVKGYRTTEYKRKRKAMIEQYGIRIKES